jgi:hypothetical protein
MNIPFNVKFTIFNEVKPLTEKQKQIKNKLIDMNNKDNDMKKILKYAITELNDYKFLDRVEPSISNIDETKQLRLSLQQHLNSNDEYQHSLIFIQNKCKEYFSIEELKIITKSIKNELEEYLHYEIDTFLYIEIDNL